MIDVVEIVPEKPAIGKAFKKEGKLVMDYLAQMDKDSIKEFEDKLNEKGLVKKKTETSTWSQEGVLKCFTNNMLVLPTSVVFNRVWPDQCMFLGN